MASNLNALVVFAKIVEAKSFSEAARRLEMPVSTLSRHIAHLEEQLGVRLLERSTRSLRLTDIGADVLEHAQRGAEICDAIDHIVTTKIHGTSGLIHISAPPNISDSFIAPLINGFQASYPDIRVRLFVTDRYVDCRRAFKSTQ